MSQRPRPAYAAPVMYEPPTDDEPPGCREVWVLTRAAFGVLIPVLLAMLVVLGAVTGAIVLLAVHPALALLPVGALVAGILLFVRWERTRFRPPEA